MAERNIPQHTLDEDQYIKTAYGHALTVRALRKILENSDADSAVMLAVNGYLGPLVAGMSAVHRGCKQFVLMDLKSGGSARKEANSRGKKVPD